MNRNQIALIFEVLANQVSLGFFTQIALRQKIAANEYSNTHGIARTTVYDNREKLQLVGLLFGEDQINYSLIAEILSFLRTLLPEDVFDNTDISALEPIFEALWVPERIEIVEIIVRTAGQLSVSELNDAMSIAIDKANFSRHLRYLRETGLIYATKTDHSKFYWIVPETWGKLLRYFHLIQWSVHNT